ncbi:hypothetical protein [Lapillicoccus jejuensis]|uniref:Uncharacterized protein n=1 Tax=Lapillicoccus jejuensis TaxID=402171 RepID=A0A542E4S0_9MICO|nr:hypothetical protein [Lapillicoccus jejuensis]TQJ10340.1 hypothetical protein FB458_3460 [Lapillicoccus jejuensis]
MPVDAVETSTSVTSRPAAAPADRAGPSGRPAHAGTGSAATIGSAAEAAAIAALRKMVAAAEAKLALLQRQRAGDHALQGARIELATASSALANALADQARRAQEAAAAGGLDTYA